MDHFLQLFRGPLFAGRSCIVSIGALVPFPLQPKGVRLIVLEAGSCRAVAELPGHLNNELFCPQRPPFTFTEPFKASLASPEGHALLEDALAFLALSPTASLSYFLALLMDQLLQIAIDWWLLCAVVAFQRPDLQLLALVGSAT